MKEIKFRSWIKEENIMLYGLNATENGYFTHGFRHRKSEVKMMQYVCLLDIDRNEIYEDDILEYTFPNGDVRKFIVSIETVIREIVTYPNFYPKTCRVAITGVVFKWDGYKMFPCINGDGVCDNEKMKIIGNIHEGIN